MIIRRFLQWTATAPAAARAEGAAALARVYLSGELDAADMRDAETAMTSLLDDGSPLVRMALATALADTPAAPHHLITGLAADRSDIAAIVLETSPLLVDAELVDAVALGDAIAQSAIARRPDLSVGVAAALAEVGTLEACLVLCANGTATIAHLSLSRLIRRFGGEPELREAMGRRDDLDPGLRHDLVCATAQALERFVTDCAWLSPDRAERVTREAQDQACIAIATETGDDDGPWRAAQLVDHLRSAGRLTPALLMRAILCGNLSLFEAAMSDLSGMPLGRVSGLVRGGRSLGFSALYAKSGLPAVLLPVFEAAVREAGLESGAARVGAPRLRRPAIRAVLAVCDRIDPVGLEKVVALLRRLDAEAALSDARSSTLDMLREPAVALLPRLTDQDRSGHLRSAA